MSEEKEEERRLTEEGRLVVQITKAFFAKGVNEVVQILGRYMDKHRMNVSVSVLNEFELAGQTLGAIPD